MGSPWPDWSFKRVHSCWSVHVNTHDAHTCNGFIYLRYWHMSSFVPGQHLKAVLKHSWVSHYDCRHLDGVRAQHCTTERFLMLVSLWTANQSSARIIVPSCTKGVSAGSQSTWPSTLVDASELVPARSLSLSGPTIVTMTCANNPGTSQ